MPGASSAKRGFTLFELLIVVVLIAIIYGIFVQKITPNVKKEEEKLSLITLKKRLLRQEFTKSIKLLCFEPCDKCQLFIDGKAASNEDIALFDEPVKVYKSDKFGQLINQDFLPYFDKKGNKLRNVCFAYTIYNNRASSYMGVEYKKKYYAFSSYMDDVKVFDSMSDLSAFFDKKELLPQDKLDYDH